MTPPMTPPTTPQPPTPSRVEDVLPLTPLQEGMLFHALHGPDGVDVYTTQLVLDLAGPVRSADLRAAAQALLDRHPGLRACFRRRADGGSMQVVVRAVPVDWREVDLSAGPAPERALGELLDAERRRRFDPARPPLLRFVLVRVGAGAHRLVLTNHHILLDGWSAPLLVAELAQLYRTGGDPAGLPPVRPHRDHLHWLAGRDDAAAERAWRVALEGVDEPTRVRPAATGGPPDLPERHRVELDETLTGELVATCRRHGVTVNTAVQLVWAVLLGELTGATDVVFGETVAGRPVELDGADAMVGSFINAVPVRVRLDPAAGLAANAAALQAERGALLGHQHLGLARIQAAHGIGELFDTMTVFENYPVGALDEEPDADERALRITDADGGGATHYPLSLIGSLADGRLALRVDTRPDLFEPAEARRVTGRLHALLTTFARAPGRLLAELDPLPPTERHRVLVEFNRTGTARAVGGPGDLAGLLAAQAAGTPDALAVLAGEDRLSYRELDDRVDRLAGLLARRGVGPGDVVAVRVPRSVELPVAVLGVLRAGAAYLPLDPDHPADRVERMLADARPAAVVTADTVAESREHPGPVAPVAVDPAQPAYVMYTSGSTGRPKGVVVPHAAVLARLAGMQSAFGLEPGERVLHKTPVTFDVAGWELFWPLARGATLVVAPPDAHRDPAALAAVIRRDRVGTVHFVPSMLRLFLAEPEAARCTGLRRVFSGGEPLTADLQELFHRTLAVPLINGYGPTEATVDVTFSPRPPGRRDTPIGAPVPGTRLYVLDPALRPVGVGVRGELHIAGEQLAHGYLGRPAATAERFVADPFGAPGSRLYRSGDLVRWRADGELEFVGRVDGQVKVNGQRVELGEIERALVEQDGVTAAAAAIRDGRLVGYVTPAAVDGPRLRERLATRLPAALVPAAVLALDALPLTPSGKLDRGALPTPEFTATGRAPLSPREQIVCELFAEVLGLPAVGVDDSFFALGGHSLLAVRLISRVRAALGVELPVQALFTAPTVQALLALADGGAPARSAPTRRARPDRVPLSPAQQRLWFLSRLDGPAPHIATTLRVPGGLRVEALRAALADVAGRHETLRTVIEEDADGPHLVVGAAVPELVTLQVPPAELDAALSAATARPFDLATEPPWRAVLVGAGGEQVLLLVVHHIAGDAGSTAVLLRDLATAYSARDAGHAPDLPEPALQYADYALWQHELLGAGTDPDGPLATQLRFWRTALAGAPAELELPADRPRPAGDPGPAATVELGLDAGRHRALLELARHTGVTPFMVVQAALAVLLTRLGAGTDIPLGAAVSGRHDESLDEVVGFFVNTVVLRTDTAGDPTFRALLDRVRATDLAAFAHQDVPFERVVEELNPPRSLTRHPLFQVMLTYGDPDRQLVELAGVAVEPGAGDAGPRAAPAHQDLSFHLRESSADGAPAGVEGVLEYATARFDPASAAALAARLVRVLECVLDDPDVTVGRVALLAAEERHHILESWNDTAHPVAGELLPELLAARVRATPGAPAVTHGGTTLSYADLHARANRLARRLVAAGVGPERFVAVRMARSVDLLVALVAVIEAGAAYLPVEPGHPADRIAAMLDQVDPVLVLDGPTCARLEAEAADLAADGLTDADRCAPLRPANPAFVIFTSGSTGRPKGVVVEHRSLRTYLAWARHAYPAVGGRSLVHSPVSFDLTVTGLFATLTAGGQVHLVDLDDAERASADPAGPPTFVKATPSHLPVLLTLPPDRSPTGQLVLGGESLVGEVLDEWRRRHPGATVVNEYGPTETTVGCTEYRIAPGDRVPGGVVTIGRPVWNTRMYVLDAGLEPVPPGVAGELYIAGELVTRGYHGRPGPTAGRFVADPHGPAGARMYRSGDLARWSAGGLLEFLARTDDQVKLRGFRIEPGEVEAVLTARPDVARAAVVVREDRPGDRRLVAYVVAAGTVDPAALRTAVAERLPEYMVPSAVVVLDALPVTANHKLDRAALPAPELVVDPAGRAPRNPVEHRLCALFAEVLGLPEVGPDDDFFVLGGHSLLATRLVGRIRGGFGCELALREVFEAPTVAGLAERLADRTAADPVRPPLVAGPHPARLPLSAAQRRLWFLHRLEGPSPTYNLPLVLRLTGPLDRSALRAAVADLADRHEPLRTVLPEDDGEPTAVASAAPVPVEFRDCPAADVDDELAALARHGFDLTVDLPVRVWALEVAPDEHVVLVLVHHIASDGWSAGPLTRDLLDAYAARRAGRRPEPAPLPVRYADYVRWQRELLGDERDPASRYAEQVRFWRDALAGAPEVLQLPADRPRPPVLSHRGDSVELAVGPQLHAAVTDLARRTGTTVFMVLQAALATLLTRLGAGTDVPIGTPLAGRLDPALDDLVGLFVNTLVLRTDTSGAPSFAELLQRVRHTDLAAHAHQDVPFERLVEELDPVRSLANHPLFQVVLTLQGDADARAELPGLAVAVGDVGTGVAKSDLWLSLRERTTSGRPDGIEGVLGFAVDLFDPRTAAALAERLVRLLAAATADPDLPIDRIDLLGAAERERLLRRHSGADRPAPAPATLPELFAAQVRRTPDRPAVQEGPTPMSYAELDARSARLARRLAAAGVGPEQRVAVALPRSAELVVAQLAVARTGAAWVPVDLDYPAERIEYLLADAAPSLVLTRSAVSLPGPVPAVLAVDVPDNPDNFDKPDGSLRGPRPENPAYVIYTSGSTGRPKGVQVSHAGLAALVANQRAAYQVDETCRVLQNVSPSFDVSVAELCMALLSGGCLVVPPGPLAGAELAEEVRRTRVTHLHVPPSVLAGVPRMPLPDLRVLVTGAEPCPADLVAFWSGGRLMVNAYGPTEASVDVTCALLGRHRGIGRPIPGARTYLLDERLQPVPAGVTGELYVGGAGLARGYLDRPGQTAERFVAHPWGAPGERLYRTGDLARWTVDGELEFAGRADAQLKIRGFRVEPGEIESVLRRHPAVARAVVVARADGRSGPRLVAYLVAAPDTAQPDVADLRAHAAAELPGHLVPAAWVWLDALPLTPNGKLDARALPAPATPTAAGRGPRSAREHLVGALFAEVLGLERVGVEQDFFELGGHSLLATRLAGRIRAAVGDGCGLGTQEVFQNPTVAGLAATIDRGRPADPTAGLEVLLPLRRGGSRPALFCLPPSTGLGWAYAGLVRHLGDRPLYALQARGLTGSDRPPRTRDELVEDYLDRIVAVQPQGPYHLLGYSLGGPIAHAVAAGLRRRGRAVGLLAVLDGEPGSAADLDDTAVLTRLHADLSRGADPAADEETRRAAVRDFLGREVFPGLAGDRLDTAVDAVVAAVRVTVGTPPPEFDGDLLLVTSTSDPDGGVPLPRAWAPWVRGAVRVRRMDCPHADLLDPDRLGAVAGLLTECLADLPDDVDIPPEIASATAAEVVSTSAPTAAS